MGPRDELKYLLKSLTQDLLEGLASSLPDQELQTLVYKTNEDIEKILEYIDTLPLDQIVYLSCVVREHLEPDV